MSAPVTLVVLTFNEEANLAACLDSVRPFAAAMFVVDSGSTDATLEIAKARGATVVTHAFETHSKQWMWALSALPIATPWVLALDADQAVTPELAAAIVSAVASGGDVRGYFMARRQIFRGRWIRHGGYYPKYLLKLFERSAVRLDETELVDHHFHVDGPVARLGGDLIEDNRNEARIADWIAKHNRYAALQARQELQRDQQLPRQKPAALAGPPDARVRWWKDRWATLPLFVRPWIYFLYRYIVRLGFLDGREGFIFHFMQALWYRMLVDVNRDEITRARTAAPLRATEPRSTAAPATDTQRIS